MTAVVGPKKATPPPAKIQPPIVSMYPIRPSQPPLLKPEIIIPPPPPPGPAPKRTNTSQGLAKSNGIHNLPVLHIPEYTPSSYYKKAKKADTKISSNNGGSNNGGSNNLGHPGMPNGLLQVSTSLQQKTKVTPKDQNARMALSKIGLIEPSPITVSMAKSAASAVTVNRVS